jgi:hypothetical protein
MPPRCPLFRNSGFVSPFSCEEDSADRRRFPPQEACVSPSSNSPDPLSACLGFLRSPCWSAPRRFLLRPPLAPCPVDRNCITCPGKSSHFKPYFFDEPLDRYFPVLPMPPLRDSRAQQCRSMWNAAIRGPLPFQNPARRNCRPSAARPPQTAHDDADPKPFSHNPTHPPSNRGDGRKSRRCYVISTRRAWP